MKALAIAGANVRRLLRDRTGLFFVFVFPIVIIITIGATFGGGFVARLGVVSPGEGPLEAELVELSRTRGLQRQQVRGLREVPTPERAREQSAREVYG